MPQLVLARTTTLLLLGSLAAACSGDDGEVFTAGIDSDDESESGDGDGDGDEVGGDCGNGEVENGEECDLGEGNAASAACTPECTINVCGDGFRRPEYEDCDDGNSDESDSCKNDCSNNVCGDGIVEVGVEVCDDGNDDPLDGCKNDCTLTTCGDGEVDEGEQCDDGNDNQTDFCAGCMFAWCGDGYTWAGEEECDDGNDDDNDDCLSTCVAAQCGDGILNVGVETCDDGDLVDTDGCPSSCEPASCGDGFTWTGMETCDDGNNVSDDGCDAECYAEYCFTFTNTDAEDITSDDWLDTCADTPGTTVVVTLDDAEGNTVYEAQGPLVGSWTQNALTCTGANATEYNENGHDQLITLDNGDKLFISSKDADPGMNNYYCNTSMGDGYVIIVYPSNANWYINPKMVVAAHEGGHSNLPRAFVNWDPEYEISWNGGSAINTCTLGPGGLVGFPGTFTLRVKD